MTNVDRVLKALLVYGLRMRPSDLSERELDREKKIIRSMLRDGNDTDTLVRAVRYGMPSLWPYTDGRAFDAQDLRKNLLKAKAEAATTVQAGGEYLRIRSTKE